MDLEPQEIALYIAIYLAIFLPIALSLPVPFFEPVFQMLTGYVNYVLKPFGLTVELSIHDTWSWVLFTLNYLLAVAVVLGAVRVYYFHSVAFILTISIIAGFIEITLTADSFTKSARLFALTHCFTTAVAVAVVIIIARTISWKLYYSETD